MFSARIVLQNHSSNFRFYLNSANKSCVKSMQRKAYFLGFSAKDVVLTYFELLRIPTLQNRLFTFTVLIILHIIPPSIIFSYPSLHFYQFLHSIFVSLVSSSIDSSANINVPIFCLLFFQIRRKVQRISNVWPTLPACI